MASMNALKKWMDFYDREGIGGPGSIDGKPVLDYGRAGGRVHWAGLMSRDDPGAASPDFFADEGPGAPPGYVAPRPISAPAMGGVPASPRPASGGIHAGVGGTTGPVGSRYETELQRLLFTPGAFEGSAGYKFAMDQGTQAIQRAMAAKGMGGSGNEAIELTKYAAGTAAQEYGNAIDRLARINDSDSSRSLASLSSDRNFALGSEQNAISRARNATDYDLGIRRQALGESSAENEYNLGRTRASTDAYGARTSRGAARSNDYFRRMSRY